MIIEFSIQNFRSIKELQTISFRATGLKSPPESAIVDENNIFNRGDSPLLRTVGLYGANASGKSNIIKALVWFLQMIRNEASSVSNLGPLCEPFLYQDEPQVTESLFQITLFVKNRKYRYGLTVKKNIAEAITSDEKISKEIVVKEWLFGIKETNMVKLFERTGMKIDKDSLPNGEKIPPIPYEHTLFLTHAAAFDSEGACAIIRQYLSNWTIDNSVFGIDRLRRNSIRLLEADNGKQDFLNFLSKFNLKYEDIIIERDPHQPKDTLVPRDKIFVKKTYHSFNQNQEIKLNLNNNESAGTQKLFDIAGVFIRAFNLPGNAFIILDEIDSDFHPSLLKKLIEVFNNPAINKSNAQLLFTSHDTNLMSHSVMRRDQFYFTEKNEDESTRLYSLADLRGIRNDADFAKDYLEGYYGGVPVLQNYLTENDADTDGTMGN
jgi:uncharacterized protein